MSIATNPHTPSVSDTSALSIGDEIAAASDAPQFNHWRCSVEKYHEMVHWAIFHPDDRLELLDGLIVQKYHPADGPPIVLWRCSVEQYHEMTRRGIIGPEDRVELLEGFIVQKMTKYPLHRRVLYRLRTVLERSLPKGFWINIQDPVTLARSEPEPDTAVVRGDSEDFGNRHPAPSDLALVAEVADSSLSRDKVFKKNLYAKNGIPVYWLVNLVDWQIEVYTEPTAIADVADYLHCDIYSRTDNMPLILDGLKVADIAVRSILPEKTAAAD